MNQLKNGTLFIVIATVVTAVLILMTERDVSNLSVNQHDVVTIEKETSEIEELPNLVSEVIDDEDTSTTVLQKSMSSVNLNIEVAAPDGPFVKADSDLVVIENSQEMSVTENSNEKTEEMEQAINDEQITTIATSSQHDVLNHIIQPIWMDQKLGDFKSIENDGVIFKLMPRNSEGLQGENPKQVVTSKNDRFATDTISADYNYQQMPMYNGGYYIAPMPSYLMPSILPGNIGNKK